MEGEPRQERAKRLSLSQILELVLTRPSTSPSITLGRNAAGNTTIEVHVVPNGEETIGDAARVAVAHYDALRDMYPLANDAAGASAVTLSRNAKGETQIEVVARGDDAPENVSGLARVEYDRLRTAYPMASGFVGAEAAQTAPSRGGKP